MTLLSMTAAVAAAGETFACTPTAVCDGDVPIWCAEGPHVLISGIAAREMDGTCRDNQPCPSATALQARDELIDLFGGARGTNSTGQVRVTGPTLLCRSEDSAGGSRTAACRTLPSGQDLFCVMIATGTVLKRGRYWRGHRCR